MEWVRADATPEQLAADSEQCQREAYREASYRHLGYTAFGPWVYRHGLGRPFVFQPAGPFFDPYSERYLEEARFADFCMRAKGYQLAPVTE